MFGPRIYLTPDEFETVARLRKYVLSCDGKSCNSNVVYGKVGMSDLPRERQREICRQAGVWYTPGPQNATSRHFDGFDLSINAKWDYAETEYYLSLPNVDQAQSELVVCTRSGAGAGTGTGTGADPLPASALVKVKELVVDVEGYTTLTTKQVPRTGYATAAAKGVSTHASAPATAPVSAKVLASARATPVPAQKPKTVDEDLVETERLLAEENKLKEETSANARAAAEARLKARMLSVKKAELAKVQAERELTVARGRLEEAMHYLDGLKKMLSPGGVPSFCDESGISEAQADYNSALAEVEALTATFSRAE